MALVLSEDETMLVDAVRGTMERNGGVGAFRALRDSGEPMRTDRALFEQLAQGGFIAPHVSEEDSGLGMGAVAAGLVMERAGHVLAAAPLLSAAMSTTLIAQAGDEAQRAEWLVRIIAGEAVIAPALDERPRHDPDTLTARATLLEDVWNVTGDKTAVIDGVGADAYLVSALDHSGTALFLIAASSTGVEVSAIDSIDSRNLARVTFSGAKGQRLPGDAALAIAAALDLGRALLAAELLGIADEAFDRTVAYLKERKQFGRFIGTFQALQHRAARIYAGLDLSRGVVLKALRAIEENDAEAGLLASLAKGTMTRLAREVLVEAVQMHGGIGVTDEFDMGLFAKRARAASDLLGDDYFHTERLARERWGL
jgi:alkylation response protein AidB-like acyl-CoA dehydrogenase